MPHEGPVPDLGGLLGPLLLGSLGWLGLIAALGGAVTWWARTHPGADRAERFDALLGRSAQDGAEPAARRFLRVSVGLLWVLDGALQAQPDVPAGFLGPLREGLATSPAWFADLLIPLVRVWTWHPVLADATTVWVQVGLGILFLVARGGALFRVAAWASIGWSLLVWVAGEFLGGLLTSGAGWLTGAPGAVLVYVLAAGLLLAPWTWWDSGRTATLARRLAGGWFLLGAGLQALPGEGWWAGAGLSGPFAEAAAAPQPGALGRPIAAVADIALAHPYLLNAAIVAALALIGSGLILTRSAGFVGAGVALCAATWWLAQDFGVLEDIATDPNTGLPLGLLLACALPSWPVREPAALPTTGRSTGRSRLRAVPSGALATLGVAALLAPLAVAGQLLGPADAAALAADNGGLVRLPPRAAPAFRLTDQHGHTVTQDSLGGELTLVTFLDPVCSDDCPVIANQLAVAARLLGTDAGRVQILAIDSNPLFTDVADVRAFTRSHGLSDLPSWHFLAGPPADLQEVVAAYGVVVQVPAVGMIEHDEGVYVIGADGQMLAYLADGANADLTTGYATTLSREIRRLLSTGA